MEHDKNLYDQILSRIRSVRKRERIYDVLASALNAGAIVLTIALVVSAVEMIARGDESFRTGLAIASGLGLLAALAYYVGPAALRALGILPTPDDMQTALRIGGRFPEIKDRLGNAIQIVSDGDGRANTSRDLANAAFYQVAQASEGKNFAEIIDKRKLNRSVLIFLSLFLVSSILFSVFGSSFGAAFGRVMNYDKSFAPPANYSLEIEPKEKTALRGEKAEITAKAVVENGGVAPAEISLFIKEENQKEFDELKLELDSGDVYRYEIPALKNSLEFYASSRWLETEIKSEIGVINVIDKPIIRSMNGRVVYPGYSGVAPKSFDERVSDISGLVGSLVNLSVLVNKKVESAAVAFEMSSQVGEGDSARIELDTIRYELGTSGKEAAGAFRLTKSGAFWVEVVAENGESNESPVRYGVIALYDDFPTITAIEPTENVEVGEEASLPIRVEISDDYGFSKLVLWQRLAESGYGVPEDNFSPIEIPIYTDDTFAEIPYIWDLTEHNIAPSDKFEFYLEISDNDVVSGPKTAKTRTFSVRMPSLDELLSEAEEDQNKIEQEMEKALKKADEIKKDVEELNRDLLKNPDKKELDWKQEKKLEDIFRKKQDLRESLEKIQRDMQATTSKLDKNQAISPETMQKYMELRQLLREVDSPELRKMQEQMNKAMKNVSPEDLRRAMEKIQTDEEDIRKSMERAIELLKRLKAEQKADEIARRAEDLAKRQEELAEETKNADPKDQAKRDELSKKQESLQKDMNSMLSETEDLDKALSELNEDAAREDLDDAKQALDPQETSEAMQNSSEQMKNGEMQKSQKSQQKASQNLSEFSEKMKEMKQNMHRQSREEAMRKMQKAVNDITSLSKDQEALKNKTRDMNYNSNQFSDITKKQSEISDGLKNVANAMLDLGKETTSLPPNTAKALGDALEEMEGAKNSLTDRRARQAAGEQGAAMAAMNKALSQMQAQLNAMQNQGAGSCDNPGGQGQGNVPGGGQSYQQRLQQLAAQQQALNMSMRQALGQGGRLSQEQRAEMGRLAGEQGKAQRALREMSKEEKNLREGDKQSGDDLEKIAKEMEETMADLESGRITPETLRRQERILSRLLDASRSVHERDFEKKRESQTGQNVYRASPDDIDLSTQEGRKQAMRDYLRSLKTSYSKDYEILIKQYYKALEEEDAR